MSSKIDYLGDKYKETNSLSDFNNLIRSFRPEILHIVQYQLKRSGCPLSYAEDIESEIEYKLYSSIPSKYDPSEKCFSKWAHVLIMNHTRDYIKGRKKMVEFDESLIPSDQRSILDNADFEIGIQKLSPIQRTSIDIVFIKGHTYKEAGKIIGVSTGTVWNLCQEAISIIKETFNSDEFTK